MNRSSAKKEQEKKRKKIDGDRKLLIQDGTMGQGNNAKSEREGGDLSVCSCGFVFRTIR